MADETRFQTGFLMPESDEPGIVQPLDGTVWIVKPDGTRFQITPGGGGGGCEYFTCDTDEGTASVIAPSGAFVSAPQTTLQATALSAGDSATFRATATNPSEEALASVEAGYDGSNSQGYASAWVVSPDGNHSGGLYAQANDADGATLELSATKQISAISTAAATGDNPAVFMGASAAGDPNRAYVEAGTGGVSDESSYGRLVALRSNGQGARLELLSENGGDSSYALEGDKVSFGNGVEPITRPTLDPATATAEQVAQALVDLGLALEP